jgi:hypothetical protein
MRALGKGSIAFFISIIVTFADVGVAVALALTVFLTVLLAFLPAPPNLTVTVPVSFSVETPTGVSLGRPGFGFEILNARAQVYQDLKAPRASVDGSLQVPAASKGFIAANSAALIAILVFALFVLRQLRTVLRTLTDRNPFVPENAVRIRRIALAVIAGELVRAGIFWIETRYAATHVSIAGVTFDAWPHVSLTTVVLGFIILVIAEVFRAGTRLDEEQSLTI